MIREILTPAQRTLVADELQALEDLRLLLERLGTDAPAQTAAAAAHDLDPLFLVAVTGAASAAVDPLADALLEGGGPEPPERVEIVRSAGGIAAGDPPAWHGRADLALVMTRAHHPLAGDDQTLLATAAGGATRAFVVVDEIEMLRLTEDVARMQEAVEATSERLLGRAVSAYGVSTARIGRGRGEEGALAGSWIPALARQVEAALRSPAVLAPKLRRAAETGRELAATQRAVVEQARAGLEEDAAHLAAVEAEVAGLEAAAGTALRETTVAVDGVLADYARRAEGFIRRRTRPFRGLGGPQLGERFAADPAGRAREDLDEASERLERTIDEAAEAARRRVVERLAASPTERSAAAAASSDAVDPAASDGPPGESPGQRFQLGCGPEAGGTRQVDHGAPGQGEAVGGFAPAEERRGVADPVRSAGWLAAVLLVAGVLFAAVPFLGGLTGLVEARVLAVALGGGLGGAAVLAAFGLLELRRRRLVESLDHRVEERRRAAASALASLAEKRLAEGMERILGPVAGYLDRVRAERDRLDGAAGELARLEEVLGDALRRVDREVGKAADRAEEGAASAPKARSVP